ncbi:type IV pilin [Methanosarcina sp. MSH10X1]|uniref:type IV pilin N-terminal domain-containing protein n=1 Tax=Methanosarcina sp. MSH10X1 TaxID=2507075 RepID=UPI000FFCB798|nr:type IV pilin N-terminal domain-containing protein [Methanosarcina sp. MSH10X1]RXA21340.1 type IV pilin [Methanosarcina sp. MSH10X1]
MEGKKCGTIGKNCQAVSEVYGQLLMISIVVLSFSTIALTVFSDGGAVDPPHTPHIDLREKISILNGTVHTVQIVHSGGEAIDKSAISVVLSGNYGTPDEFSRTYSMSDSKVKILKPDGNNSADNVFTLGDRIIIYPDDIISDKGNPLILTSKDSIDMFFMDMPSQQAIQRTVLQRGPGKLPDWITPYPYGSVYDSTAPSGLLPMELVSAIGGPYINTPVSSSECIYHTYSFGLDADEMGILDFSKVQLKIIYQTNGDNSFSNLTLEVYNGSRWTQIASESGGNLEEYHNFNACIASNKNIYTLYDSTQNVTYIRNTDELEKLMVKFSVLGHASGKKEVGVDFIGIHIE